MVYIRLSTYIYVYIYTFAWFIHVYPRLSQCIDVYLCVFQAPISLPARSRCFRLPFGPQQGGGGFRSDRASRGGGGGQGVSN